MSEKTARTLVILLHGVGSSGSNLAPLGSAWKEMLPDSDFIAPDGPLPFEHGPGRQWFSIDGVTETNRSERIAAARAGFDRTIEGIVSAHGMSGSLDRVALVGFSQGSIMALDALSSGRWPVAAIVAFSGRLASPAPLKPSLDTPVLFVHGSADPIIPAMESERAAAALSALGVRTDLHILPGLGHTISSEGAAIAGEFLAASFS